MATAARRSADLNSLYTTSIEKWMGSGSVEETVFEANQLVWLLSKVAKETGTYGFEMVQPLMTTKNTGVGWFEYDDTLSTASMQGAEAAKFDMAFLGGPIVITEQEEIENAEPHRMVNVLKFKFDQLMLSLAEEVNLSGFRGSGTNSKSMDGLEDIVFAGDSGTTGVNPELLTRAQASSGVDNTYGGITRTGTTGWENYSIALDNNGQGDQHWDGTGGGTFTDGAWQTLENMYVYCSRGAIRPDLFLSGLNPYKDYHRLATANATYEKEIDSFRGINLGHDNTKYRNAVWLYDETCVPHSDAGSDATTTLDMLYVLNSSYLKLCVESGYDFALTPFQTPPDARISIAHILWRGQLVCTNPRYQGVIFQYTV